MTYWECPHRSAAAAKGCPLSWPPCVEGVTGGIWGDSGPARAGGACFGPDAAASVQAWHWDICGAQTHQLLSPCHRQLYLNIHTTGRLMCACLAPHGVPSNKPMCEKAPEVIGVEAVWAEFHKEMLIRDELNNELFTTYTTPNCFYILLLFMSGCERTREQLPIFFISGMSCDCNASTHAQSNFFFDECHSWHASKRRGAETLTFTFKAMATFHGLIGLGLLWDEFWKEFW